MDIYFDRIKPLFDGSGKTDADLEREIGIGAKKISQWNIGYTKSYTKFIPKIASYFHVSTDYLLGNTDNPAPAGQKESPAASEGGAAMYPEWYGKLTPGELEQVRKYAEFLIAERRKDQP